MDGAEAILHVVEADPCVGRRDVEPAPVVADLETELAIVRAQAGFDVRRRSGVLGRVLQRL